MATIDPEHAERFMKYFPANTLSLAIAPIPESERRTIMNSMWDKAQEFLAELESYKSVNFSRDEYTNSVNKKELEGDLDDLETELTEFLLRKIADNPSLVAHGEIGRMLKRVADKVSKLSTNWEAQQNFNLVAKKVEKLDVSTLRTKSDIKKDYMAIRVFYERARELARTMYPEEKMFREMEARHGNFSDDLTIPEIPQSYSWWLPVNLMSVKHGTTITDTPFFALALEYGFIDGATESYDIIDFQNDVFKNIVLPILLGLFSAFPVGYSGYFVTHPSYADLLPAQKRTYEQFVALYAQTEENS